MPTLAQRCAAIELLVLDVDGVLTDGGIVYSGLGEEWKQFHVRDGAGLKIWQVQGKQASIITGRQSPIVERRAVELGIAPVLQGVEDKRAALVDLCAQSRRVLEQVCCIGDDSAEMGMFAVCGLAAAVADASSDARQSAHYVTRLPGGKGAVREVIELILRCQGRWPAGSLHPSL